MLTVVYYSSRKWLQVVKSVGADESSQGKNAGWEGNMAKDRHVGSMQISGGQRQRGQRKAAEAEEEDQATTIPCAQ